MELLPRLHPANIRDLVRRRDWRGESPAAGLSVEEFRARFVLHEKHPHTASAVFVDGWSDSTLVVVTARLVTAAKTSRKGLSVKDRLLTDVGPYWKVLIVHDACAKGALEQLRAWSQPPCLCPCWSLELAPGTAVPELAGMLEYELLSRDVVRMEVTVRTPPASEAEVDALLRPWTASRVVAGARLDAGDEVLSRDVRFTLEPQKRYAYESSVAAPLAALCARAGASLVAARCTGEYAELLRGLGVEAHQLPLMSVTDPVNARLGGR